MDPRALMKLAIEKARSGIAGGQSPFGCAIGWRGEVLAVAHNSVYATTDVTAHAEITALRQACLSVGEVLLPGAVVATTCEPCPMCAAALHWARVDTVYYGASIADASAAGFNELTLPAAELLRIGNSDVKVVADVRADECRELFAEWSRASASSPY